MLRIGSNKSELWASQAVMAIAISLPLPAAAAQVGVDRFEYAPGEIGEVNTLAADGWARGGDTKSDWNGSALVDSQQLVTTGTRAWRVW